MIIEHGVKVTETPTSVTPPVNMSWTAAYVGTAPINMGNIKNVNVPIVCLSYEEAVSNFGYISDFEKYTLCEAIYAHFILFGTGPIVLMNVLDPDVHVEKKLDEKLVAINPNDGKDIFLIKKTGILLDTIKLKQTDKSLEFTASFDENGYALIVATSEVSGEVSASYSRLDDTLIDKEDIIGGINVNTGAKKGLELIEEVFPKTTLIPNMILSPKWSCESEVAAIMETKAKLINGNFKGVAYVDIPTDVVKYYSNAPAYKIEKNLISPFLDVCYPKVGLGDKQIHLSTQLACIKQVLYNKSGTPYESPSNKSLKADKTVLQDGSNVFLSLTEANFLNGSGIVTAINFASGWKSWGNYTSYYPSSTDPKDVFMCARDMFNFISNHLTLTYFSKVDSPTNTRLVTNIVDSENIYLNSLVASQMLVGGRIEYRPEDNPTTNLLAGKIKFKIFIAPTLPAQVLEFDLELDVNYYSSGLSAA